VIIGGIKRIASVADKIVPLMAGLYVLMSLYILAVHWSHIPAAIADIVSGAFTPAAAYGGALGVLVIGIRRASFSNEAGVGSAAIAHSAAKTDEPVSEGIVALLEPFIDTVVICTMTGLIIVITGVYADPAQQPLIAGNKGAELTANAVASVVSWFPMLLALIVFLFAYSTLISWSYYGERCATHLLGPRASLPYKVLFLCFVFLGSILAPTNVLDFSDLMILAMAFPNVLGMYILAGDVRRKLDDYWGRYQAGELKRH
jgi:AGCS family alanine or glycine:cation symporter